MTTLTEALHPKSDLIRAVRAGMGAIATRHRALFHPAVRREFPDSLNLDAARAKSHPTDPRWDYILGHGPSEELIAAEPHPGKGGDVKLVIAKRLWATGHLAAHLAKGKRVRAWLWVVTGSVVAPTETIRRRLDQAGTARVSLVLGKHLPARRPNPQRRAKRRR